MGFLLFPKLGHSMEKVVLVCHLIFVSTVIADKIANLAITPEEQSEEFIPRTNSTFRNASIFSTSKKIIGSVNDAREDPSFSRGGKSLPSKGNFVKVHAQYESQTSPPSIYTNILDQNSVKEWNYSKNRAKGHQVTGELNHQTNWNNPIQATGTWLPWYYDNVPSSETTNVKNPLLSQYTVSQKTPSSVTERSSEMKKISSRKSAWFPPLGILGTGADGALPAPPPPVKVVGSIDYILIPLILIGIAGPIFAVLYVILGAYEAKLSPFSTRSYESFTTKALSYLDTATSAVARSLEEYECIDYSLCQLERTGRRMGINEKSKMLKTALAAITPKKYERILKRLMKAIDDPKDCSQFKCLQAWGLNS